MAKNKTNIFMMRGTVPMEDIPGNLKSHLNKVKLPNRVVKRMQINRVIRIENKALLEAIKPFLKKKTMEAIMPNQGIIPTNKVWSHHGQLSLIPMSDNLYQGIDAM